MINKNIDKEVIAIVSDASNNSDPRVIYKQDAHNFCLYKICVNKELWTVDVRNRGYYGMPGNKKSLFGATYITLPLPVVVVTFGLLFVLLLLSMKGILC